jgi:hypothetical protein
LLVDDHSIRAYVRVRATRYHICFTDTMLRRLPTSPLTCGRRFPRIAHMNSG